MSRPGLFTTGREPLYPWDKRLGAPQSRFGRYGEDKNYLAAAGIRTPNLPARSLVSVLTALSMFLKIIFLCIFYLDVSSKGRGFFFGGGSYMVMLSSLLGPIGPPLHGS